MEADPHGSKPELVRLWHEYKVPIILVSVSVALVAIAIVLLVTSTRTTTPIEFSSDGATNVLREGKNFVVDVQGAVSRPGIYELPPGSRVEDAIAAAGGITDEADLELLGRIINRASKVVDGAKIYIPKGEGSTGETLSGQGPERVGSQETSLVSINAASQSELESLPGIGPVTAAKIITNRPYQSIEELVTKKVMGQSLYTKLQEQLTLW